MIESKRALVTYETRFSGQLDATLGLALLAASTHRFMPHVPLFVFLPDAELQITEFFNKFCPNVIIKQLSPDIRSFYGKPKLVRELLNSGFDRVTWIDADILVTRDCENLLFPSNENCFSITENHIADIHLIRRHNALFEGSPARSLATSVSTAIFSVGRAQANLMDLYDKLLTGAFDNPLVDRELFRGDQEFLEAALQNTKESEFDIYYIPDTTEHLVSIRGIGLRKLLKVLFSPAPAFIHAASYKPWWPSNRPFSEASRDWLDVSPYTEAARSYAGLITSYFGPRGFWLGWLKPASIRSSLARNLPPRGLGWGALRMLASEKIWDLDDRPNNQEVDLCRNIK